MNILICENDTVTALDLRWMLQDMGHHVCGTAATSVQALEQCSLKNPDVVIVDLNLADGRTGLNLVEALARRHVPSIIVSGEIHTEPATTPAKAVLSKPFDDVGLAEALEAVENDQLPRASADTVIDPVGAGQTDPVHCHQPGEEAKPRRPWLDWLWRRRA